MPTVTGLGLGRYLGLQPDRPCGWVALGRQIEPPVVHEFLPKAERGHVMLPNVAGRVLRTFKHRPDRRLSDDFVEPLVLQPLEGSSLEEMGGTWPTPLPGLGQAMATPSGS